MKKQAAISHRANHTKKPISLFMRRAACISKNVTHTKDRLIHTFIILGIILLPLILLLLAWLHFCVLSHPDHAELLVALLCSPPDQ